MTDSTTHRTAISLAVLLLLSLLAGGAPGVAAQADSVSFSQNTYTDERGDVFQITVDLEGGQTGYIEIGSSEANYRVMAELTDANEDGQVTVTVNSYYALEDRVDGGVGVAGTEDEVEVLNRALPTQTRPDALSGSFELQVGTAYNPTRGVEEVQDTATMRVTPRETRSLQSWSGAGRQIEFDTREEFLERYNITNFVDYVGPTERIAKNDFVVLELRASGLFGAVETRNDLTGVGPEGNPTGLTMIVESVPEREGEAIQTVDLTDRDNVLLTDPANNTMFLVLTTQTETFQPGTVYRARFELNETNRLVEDTSPDVEFERATQDFILTDRSLSFDGMVDGDEITASSNGTITLTGTTTVARGTRVPITVRSADTGPAFQVSEEVSISREQTFQARMQIQNLTGERDVFVSAMDTFGDLANVSATVVSSDEPPATTTTTTETTTTTTTTTETTETPQERPTTTEPMMTETEATTTETDGTPGFTVVTVLVALLAVSVLARTRGR